MAADLPDDPGAPFVILDVTRLLSRLGRGPLTGIDRVEAAWLSHLQGRPHLLLARIGRRQMLLPANAGALLLRWAAGALDDLPPPGLILRLRGRGDARARAGAALSRMAIRRAGPGGAGLERAARAVVGAGRSVVYLNLGHGNLTARLWRNLGWARRVALVHDTIPLDHPEWTRAGQPAAFRDRLTVALTHADLILTVSRATRADLLRWRGRLGIAARAPVVAAPIGTTLAAPDAGALPARLDLNRPFFVALGTIEPRKNHALLLDAWEELARRMNPRAVPQLVIAGRRGWENHATFARLDALPPGGPVLELNGLSDGAVAALLEHSRALLMPSRAEGFGLPLTEAAARGIPVLSTPLPAAREILGDHALWLPPDDPRAWADAVARLAAQPPRRLPPLAVPMWRDHLAAAFRAIGGIPAPLPGPGQEG